MGHIFATSRVLRVILLLVTCPCCTNGKTDPRSDGEAKIAYQFEVTSQFFECLLKKVVA